MDGPLPRTPLVDPVRTGQRDVDQVARLGLAAGATRCRRRSSPSGPRRPGLLGEELPGYVRADGCRLHRVEEALDDLAGRLARPRPARVDRHRVGPGAAAGGLRLLHRAVVGHADAPRHPQDHEQAEHESRRTSPHVGPHLTGSGASAGTSGRGLWRSDVADPPRQRQPELRALAPAPPRLQPSAVQVGVLLGDRQPESGAATGAGPGRVGTPEPVEHHRRLPRRQADAVVAHRDRRRLLVGGHAAPRSRRPPRPAASAGVGRGRSRW